MGACGLRAGHAVLQAELAAVFSPPRREGGGASSWPLAPGRVTGVSAGCSDTCAVLTCGAFAAGRAAVGPGAGGHGQTLRSPRPVAADGTEEDVLVPSGQNLKTQRADNTEEPPVRSLGERGVGPRAEDVQRAAWTPAGGPGAGVGAQRCRQAGPGTSLQLRWGLAPSYRSAWDQQGAQR